MLWSLPTKCRQGFFFCCSCFLHTLHCVIYLLRILCLIQLSIKPGRDEKEEGNIWVTSRCWPLLCLQLAVRTNAYKQKRCVSKKANNKVLLERKHHHCVLEGTLKSMLIASLERVYKVNVPENWLANRWSDSQEEAVVFRDYLATYCTTWMRQAEICFYWARKMSVPMFPVLIIYFWISFLFPLKPFLLGVL